jgi:hypothetical protein
MRGAGVIGRLATLVKADAAETTAKAVDVDTIRSLKPGESILIERTHDDAQPLTITSWRNE